MFSAKKNFMRKEIKSMKNYIIKQLNIDPERIKNLKIIEKESGSDFYIELVHTFPDCEYCGGHTISNGFARPKPINHPTIVNENNRIIFKPIRYKCKDCGKTFTEENPFTFSTFRNSYFALDQIMKDIANLNFTYHDIAIKNNVSPPTVQRYLDSFVSVPRQTLPENIGIDEIYSKMAKRGQSKYLCVLVDNEHRYPFEILSSRSKLNLSRYFEAIPLAERQKVRYVTIDMWQPYKDVAIKYFPNCEVACDPFHVVEHLQMALTRVRLNVQNNVEYKSDAYYLLKTWKDLLGRHVNLDNEPQYNRRFDKKLNKRELLNMMLGLNENLSMAYHLKEMYLDFNDKATEADCREWFEYLHNLFIEVDIPEYREFVNLLGNWKEEILNSFKRPYDDRKQSNALSENINRRIRTYLSVSNGVTNFIRFRKRILYALNPRIFYSITKFLKSDKYEGKKRGPYNNKEE